MRQRGHPILGAVAGFFFFLSLDLLLLTFGVVNLGSIVLPILPLLGIALGIAWAFWAPLGRQRAA
jgi:hypothetical protein